MIHKVFELEDTLVRSVIGPPHRHVLPGHRDAGRQILPALREHLIARARYERSIDVIVGILYTKDLLPTSRDCRPTSTSRRTCTLRTSCGIQRADTLLQEFQAKSSTIAIVFDEYGGTAGSSPSRTCWKS